MKTWIAPHRQRGFIGQALFCQEAARILVDGADFDGANDYMTRGAGLSGAADSKTGIFAAWYRVDAVPGGNKPLIAGLTTVGGATPRFSITHSAGGLIDLAGWNAAGTLIMAANPATSYGVSSSYRSLLINWDLTIPSGTNRCQMYVNDVDQSPAVSTWTNDNIDYTVADWSIGAYADGSNKLDGCLSEVLFLPGQTLNFHIVGNRRKFFSTAGKPTWVGTNGSAPTGTAALVYQHLADGEAAANFSTNRGTGGNFTITGTLDTASSSPSD